MKKLILAISVAGTAALVIAAAAAIGGGGNSSRADLDGYQEVPTVSTVGHGSLEVRLGDDTIRYVLEYEGVETTANQAHIHLGRTATTGGVSAFLCGGGDKPACPATAGTVEGEIDAADVIGPNGQGIEPGSIGELIRAIKARATYANVHTTRFPGGEIRGALGGRGDKDDG